MGTESQQCVDQLLVMMAEINKLSDKIDSQDNATEHTVARQKLTETRGFIENNRHAIPAYTLKKIVDAMRKLETRLDRPQKKDIQFSFKSNKPDAPIKSPSPCTPIPRQFKPITVECPAPVSFCGFRDRANETLSLNPDQLDGKDISLFNLTDCNVFLRGFANTVHLRDILNSSVTVILASRAITVNGCSNCKFKLVCQQLRINSSLDCRFEIFTSARSMLEDSKGLEFKCIDIDSLSDKVTKEETKEYLDKAQFNLDSNNWSCIDDFDWLSPTAPSKNYTLIK